MVKRMKARGFLCEYQEVFDDWERLKIIERVPENELKNEKCHYLPHRPVIKMQSETTRIRPVFDASTSEKGKPSLNHCLFKGINLIELIPDVIDRFRTYPIGLSGDIEKAFLILSVANQDREFLKFFYPCDEGLVYRNCRVVFGVSCSPFLLNASMLYLLDNSPPEFHDMVEKLRGSFYVDNCLTGVKDTCDQASFIERTQTLMSRGGFNMRGWVSNVACELISKHSGDASVLGLSWNLDADKLRCSIDFEVLSCETVISKRLILSLVQKIFDPIGILCAVTLPPTILLQDTWKLKVGWDIELPPDVSKKFFKWANELYLLKEVCLPRFMPFNEGSELHVFVDARRVA
ncbi:hypothetical protein AVEN_159608-1 [Araneus ventricosus]|uniref:Reverse transcriptase domain-containing protein n=1 Tax=Araneus ventricosus TaxID=182803 RepID=A0A4Y2PPA1_ARAVE|nr:hypothetical protein AVEN_159608-1 [Araneus ventricosus]